MKEKPLLYKPKSVVIADEGSLHQSPWVKGYSRLCFVRPQRDELLDGFIPSLLTVGEEGGGYP